MARKRGETVDERFPEPDLLPILNIIFMLILAMVSMAALLPLGLLSSEAQKLSKGGAAAAPEEKKPLNLIVLITEGGFNISVRGEVKMGPNDPEKPGRKLALIPNIKAPDGSPVFDYEGLRQKLVEYKALDSNEVTMTITADSEIPFYVITNTMDAARYVDPAPADGKPKQELFPKVSFAAGIVS